MAIHNDWPTVGAASRNMPPSAHRTTVANSSDLSWKPIFSDKPTLHDSSENIVEECNSVTVTVTSNNHPSF